MESWINLFHEHIKPNHEKYGIPKETGPRRHGCRATAYVSVNTCTGFVRLVASATRAEEGRKEAAFDRIGVCPSG